MRIQRDIICINKYIYIYVFIHIILYVSIYIFIYRYIYNIIYIHIIYLVTQMFGGVQGVEQQGKSQLRFSIHQRKGPSCQRWPEPRQVSTSQEKHCYVTMIDTAASHRGMFAVLSPKVFKCHVKSCWHFLNLFSTRLNPDCHCMPPSVSIIRRLPPKLFFGAKKVSLSTFFSWTFLAASITSSINQIP